jgi:hypothetical protein
MFMVPHTLDERETLTVIFATLVQELEPMPARDRAPTTEPSQGASRFDRRVALSSRGNESFESVERGNPTLREREAAEFGKIILHFLAPPSGFRFSCEPEADRLAEAAIIQCLQPINIESAGSGSAAASAGWAASSR